MLRRFHPLSFRAAPSAASSNSLFKASLPLFSWKAPNNSNSSNNKGSNNNTNKVRSNPLQSSSVKRNSPLKQQQQQDHHQKNNKSNNDNDNDSSDEGGKKTLYQKLRSWWKSTPTVKELALVHGPGFAIWYFILNTIIQLAMASMLYYNIAGHLFESRELANQLGMVEKFDNYANQTYYLLKTPIAVNGRFIANYVLIATMMAPVIPVKISWTLATYPIVLKMIPRGVRPNFNSAAKVTRAAK